MSPPSPNNVETPIKFEVGTPLTVCYDPLNPKNAEYGDRPSGDEARTALIAFILGVLVIAAVLLSIWYGV